MENKQKEFLNYYSPIHKKLTDYCRAVTGNIHDAEDLMNDTIAAVFENYEKIRNKNVFKSYVFGVASRLNKRRYRGKQFRVDISLFQHEQLPDNELNAELKTDFIIISENIQKLPDQMRDALLLFYVSDLSIEEIGIIQNCSSSAVKQRLKRGRDKLLSLLNCNEKAKAVLLLMFF